ncbi:MAG TPA: LCP family protein, partial [Chloroflexota bacterium]|nr:LCP family protein [Chloroflexota bacterium]
MRKFVLWLLILLIVATMGGSIAYAVRPYVDAAQTISEITGVKAGTNAIPTFTPAPSPTTSRSHPVSRPTVAPTAVPLKTPKHRLNFLILASDNDSKFIASGTKLSATSGVFPNTQVMIFVSYDPVSNQVYMISIPRDLWVQIPGYGYNKISLAAGYGDISAAINTVEANFGVSIDHYAWVGLFGFIKIINSVGGLDVNAIHPMVENDFP